MTIRPRRSFLYLPGSNARALEKARSLPVDGLILDLEDAVAPAAKELAREQITGALRQGGYGRREVIVRVNALNTCWGAEDVSAVAGLGADGVLFPKIESAEQVFEAVEALRSTAAPAGLSLWVMAETPRAILDIDAIAGASERLGCVVMGTSDLARDMRVPHTPQREGLLVALAQCVLAARAHGLDILDGVHLDLRDPTGFEAACRQGRQLGFDGKTLIHPQQIDMANTVFGPQQQDIERARRIIDAWQHGDRAGHGVVVVDGRLVESLHVEEARRCLALAAAVAALQPD